MATARTGKTLAALVGPACGVAAFAAYSSCVGPVIGPGDSAELTLAALKLGIAHPPGYPLFLWLCRIATLLSANPALAANLLTALLCAAAVTALHCAARSLGTGIAGSAVAALLFAFAQTFWLNAASAEVYGLSMLLLALGILLSARSRTEPRLVPAAAFAFGLALAHQPSALLWLPGLLALCLGRDTLPQGRALALSAGAFLLGLSSSLGTLLRALARPEVNWGDPSTLARFIAHATVRQYADLAGAAAPLPRIAELPRVLSTELGIAGLVLVVLGLIGLAVSRRRALLALLLLAAGGAFGLTYAVPDFRVQLLPSLLALCLVAGVGVDSLAARLGRARPVAAMALLAPMLLFFTGLGPARESRSTAVRDLGVGLLHSLPGNAVLVAGGDVPANSVRYVQVVEGTRPDAAVVSADLLFSATYVNDVPDRLGIDKLPGFDALVRAGGSGTRAQRLQGTLAALASAIAPNRPVALTGELLTPEFFAGPLPRLWQVVPRGIVYWLAPADAALALDSLIALDDSLWRGIELASVRRRFSRAEYADVQLAYASSRNNLGMFLIEQGRPGPAIELLRSALEFPGTPQFRAAVAANLSRARAALAATTD